MIAFELLKLKSIEFVCISAYMVSVILFFIEKIEEGGRMNANSNYR